MGVVIVGPSGCGKSTVLKLLWLALQKIGIRVNRHILNPKAMPRFQLLGRIDPDTRGWTDGVLTRSARDLARENSDTKAWIVCDGDIDPEWVESLNSVLDDNRLLTLPNGERIQFGANINFLFETHELTCASPATVSRMGVIFISDEMLDARALVGAWLLKQPEDDKAQLSAFIDPNFYICLDWVRKKNECLIGTSYVGTILNGLSHLVGATTCARFTVGLIRGLGANLPESAKSQLALKVCEVMGEHPPDPTHPLNIQVDPNSGSRLVTYPHGVRIVFPDKLTSPEDYTFALAGDVLTGSNPGINCNSISSIKPPLVITPHVRCAMDSFRCWLEDARAQQSFLLIGPEGCGKSTPMFDGYIVLLFQKILSMLLEYCMASSKRATQVALVQCAAQTRPSHVLEKLTQYCITVTSTNSMGSNGAGRVLRPKEGDRLILFLRDLNLPKPDKWGSCELTAFLQQVFLPLLTYKGFYDSTTLDFIGVEGIQVVATLTPTTTAGMVGRYALSPRLTSILRIASITSPDREELNNIYHSILQVVSSTIQKPQETVIQSRPSGVEGRSRLHALASTMVQAWLQLEQTFRANKYPHCTFSLRDLTRLILAFQRYEIALTPESAGADIWLFFGYEARRLFRDRLPGEEHRFHFDRLFSALLHGTGENEEVLNELILNEWSSGLNSLTTFSSKTLSEASLASRFATGEPIMDQRNGDNSEPRGQYDLKSLEKGQYWFVTWGSKSPLVPGVPVPHCGHPLGLVSYDTMHKLASQGLKELARETSVRTGDIVLFPDFLDLVARIDRVLSRPAGSLLLCGRCGIGRRSAVKLVAHIHQLPIFTLGVGRGYVIRNFFNDLKAACQSAAIEDMPTVLLIEEQQLVQDTFLETINSLLACGEAPGLISAEELETMALTNGSGGNLHEAAAEAGHQGTLMSFFAKRVHANLHIVIILDIDDSMSLVQRLQANPSLYKHCEVHWLDKWSANSHFLLPRLLVPNLASNLNRDQFSRACLAIHNGVPYRELASPHRFMILCSTYQHLEAEHRGKLESQIGRLRAGLLKLDEARQHVIQLKATAAEQGKQLTEKQAEADRALAEISAAMQSAGKQRAEMQELQKKSALEASDLEKRKAAIDRELAEIEPILKEAQSAVGSIRSEALSEMRALRAPPDVIRDILEGVLLLMGVRDTSWVSMRSFLARRGVQEEIRNFDARKISRELRLSVEQLLKRSADSFTARAARRASVAAAPLAAWVQANVQFASVLERIAPLEEEQSRLTRSLEATEVALSQLEHELNTVDVRVAELRNTFESHTKAATDLRMDLSKANNTLTVAENLVAELEGEHTRWNNQVSTLSESMEALPATTLVSAGFITYLSACSEDVRENTVTSWWEQLDSVGLKIPSAYLSTEVQGNQQSLQNPIQSHHHFDLRRFLTTEKEMLQWKSQGLPSDQLSGENAVVILKVIQYTESLGANIISPRATVKIGEKNVDYNEEFRLFMTTRQPLSIVGTVLPVCATSLVTVVNFQTTRAGLVGQLLEISLQHERAELEARRQELLKGEEDKKMELAQLEDNLLEELANARGNILENTDLLESLNKTKATSIKVMQSLTEFERLQAELESEREEFRHLAEGGSKVFFAMKDLVRINRMYQFSLKSFINLFRRALDSPQAKDMSRRLNSIILIIEVCWNFACCGLQQYDVSCCVKQDGWRQLFCDVSECTSTLSPFGLDDESLKTDKKLSLLLKRLETLAVEYVSRALFKVDRLMFAMHITYCLRSDCIASQEWAYFINGPTSDCKVDTDRLPSWVPVDRTIAMCNLKVCFLKHYFEAGQPELYERLLFDNGDIWSRWMTSRDAEEGRLPAALSDLPLTPFQVLLVIQALRPAELQRSMKQFAKNVSLQRLYNTETRAEEPILIIISPGADPSQELAEAAQASIGKGNYNEVAMGQGQADLALSEITSAAESGSWVCLKNLHLVTFWLPVLEKHINTICNLSAERAGGNVNCESSSGPKLHPNFRLWLTTEPQQNFPSTLLQSCLKVTYEAPPGLRNNLKRTYESWNADYVAKGNSASRATALASLAWFHAVLQERRGFIPQVTDFAQGKGGLDARLNVNEVEKVHSFPFVSLMAEVAAGKLTHVYHLQGWTKFYEFSFVDIRAAANVIDRLFSPSASSSAVSSGIWKSIKGLLNNAIYGGRMDNAFDVKVLETFLDQILFEPASWARSLSPALPTSGKQDYVTAIDQLPDVDLPLDLGLPANIGKTAQQTAAAVALGQLRELQRNIDHTAFCDRALWSKELSPVLILWKKLNHDGSLLPNKDGKIRATLAKIEETSLKDPKESPVLSFLHREMSDTLVLISTIHQNLGGISKLLRGTHALTQGIEVIIQSLLRGETPALWLECWPAGPEDYLNFLNVLMRKASALQKWVTRSETCVPFISPESAFDLADLLNPGIFLNAVRQQTARQSRVPIDELKLVSKWPCSKLPQGTFGVQALRITGLQLEGACFEGGQLADCQITSPTITELPELILEWTPKVSSGSHRGRIMGRLASAVPVDDLKIAYRHVSSTNSEPLSAEDSISLPVYFDTRRSNLVTKIKVPCQAGSQQRWIQNGVALFVRSF
ncbi:unnamed protein product [Schistocephalus solidus]|uniref:Cytoplasmic dynein 2 heavy chain 1 n=1 Tax=Schistocephalus solidus TaxID=70667 RepID=A0A183SVM3_SCHSO|nr:unnamed protein product [Schistocephalus solidus]